MENQETKTVLIAEDEGDLSAAVKTVLADAGYTVIVATDGEQALTKAREATPHMILLDLNMPKKDGLEVLKELRADETFKDIPITILTAYDNFNNIAEVTMAGGVKTDFLSKSNHSLEQILEHVKTRLAS